jgi:hypothetical protein
MQNDLLPLDVYDRRSGEARYFVGCDTAPIQKDYAPYTTLVAEWQAAALARWEGHHVS